MNFTRETFLDDVHLYNKICHVLKGQMPGLGQMWGPVMIFTCQIPDFAPGWVSRNNDIYPSLKAHTFHCSKMAANETIKSRDEKFCTSLHVQNMKQHMNEERGCVVTLEVNRFSGHAAT